jgi:hypothetical protein
MIETTPPVQAPAWVRHAVWWHVYPIGFLGADRCQRNRLHASSPPADPTVLEVPSHGWEVAF